MPIIELYTALAVLNLCVLVWAIIGFIKHYNK